MRIRKKSGWRLALAAVGVAVSLALVAAFNVRAEDGVLTCDQTRQMAKENLDDDRSLQRALARRYSHLLDGLMLPMNARLVLNQRPIGDLVKVTDDFSAELQNFAVIFTTYEEAVDLFLTEPCGDRSNDSAREVESLRENLISSKGRLDGLLQAYRDRIVVEGERF